MFDLTKIRKYLYQGENMHIEEKYNFHIMIKEIIETIVGSFIMAIGVSLFLLPNQLSSGGLAGIATIVYYLMGIPMGTTILVLNIPLFILAWVKLGRSFILKSLIGTISFSFFIDIIDQFPALTQDRFLACIYGGILIGIGTAIILKGHSSTGGSDLMSFLARSYNPNLRMGQVIIIIDVIIVTLNMIFFREIEIGLYSAIAIYIMGKIIDIMFEGIYFTKLVLIISEHNEEIAKEIGMTIKKGTTGLYGKGMYTGTDKLVLMCAASRGDVARVKETARQIDPKSFIIISNAREVFGLGFKRE